MLAQLRLPGLQLASAGGGVGGGGLGGGGAAVKVLEAPFGLGYAAVELAGRLCGLGALRSLCSCRLMASKRPVIVFRRERNEPAGAGVKRAERASETTFARAAAHHSSVRVRKPAHEPVHGRLTRPTSALQLLRASKWSARDTVSDSKFSQTSLGSDRASSEVGAEGGP